MEVFLALWERLWYTYILRNGCGRTERMRPVPEKILLLDGNSIVNRAFYGIPLLSDGQGRFTNGVYGFLNILFKELDEEKPEYLAVAFDTKAPTFRHRQFAEYKGTRKGMPPELQGQVPLLKQVLDAMGIARFEQEGFEADDILGTLSARGEADGLLPVVVSGDRDLLQLCSDTLKVKIPKTVKGQTTEETYYAADVVAKYGVTPREFIDMKALMGDASDNIPGVPGIGEKTAGKLIASFHSLEGCYENWDKVTPKRAAENLKLYREQAFLSRDLATIFRDMPLSLDLPALRAGDYFTPGAVTLCRELGFKNLLARYAEAKPTGPVRLPEDYHRSTDPAELERLMRETPPAGGLALLPWEENGQLVGAAFYAPAWGAWWLESRSALTQPAPELTKAELWFYDAKAGLHALRRAGCEPKQIAFSADLAAYLLDSTRGDLSLPRLAREFLGRDLPEEEELLGKGKSKKSLLALTPEERTGYLCGLAKALWDMKAPITEKLARYEQTGLFLDMELPLVRVLADMEDRGVRIDPAALKAFGEELSGGIARLSEEIYALAGEEFNILSPKQLGTVLFEKLCLPGGKKTKTGYSTAADVLDRLRGEHPLVDKVLQYRQLTKLKSTYVDGLLAVMDPAEEKLHSTFHQTVTATGRLSSSEPNLQNIPIRLALGRELRKVFIPSQPDWVFLDGDYSQIELRVLAHMAGDETLIEAFRQGQDIHRLTASQVFDTPFDQVTSLQRSNAKAVNFGIIYGIGAFSLAQDIGVSRKEAESYIESYFARYPKIKEYMDKTIRDAYENGYVTTIFHRRRPMPELRASNFVQRSFGERVAMNMPIQGTAADIMKLGMLRTDRALRESGLRARLLLQVHDELLIEAHRDDAEAAGKLLKEAMEGAATLSVPMVVDVHTGKNWYETK